VPVFQYGIFSNTDLSFFAGSNFSFGGRVHTNGNLFLAEDGGNTLTLGDKVTAYKDVIRAQLSNGYVIAAGGSYSYTVDALTTSGGCPGSAPACRALALTEGSVTGGPCPGGTVNSKWANLSKTTYNGWILDGSGGCGPGTGAKQLNLALALAGGQPIAMVQRPPTNPPGPYEDPTSTIGSARFFNQASLRILLSDTQAAITNLPAIDTSVNPYPLAEVGSSGWPVTVQRTSSASPYYLAATDGLHPPLAESPGYNVDNDYMSAAGTTLLGGYIKIEMQLAATPGTWKDVTGEILGLGISRDLMTMTAEPALSTGGTLASGKNYYYVVTALGPWGESLGVEYGPFSTTAMYNAITVYWTPMTGATGYRVYRGSSAGGEAGYIQYASTISSYTETNAALTAGSVPTNKSILHLEEARLGMAAPTFSTAGSTGLPKNTYYYTVTALGPWGETTGVEAKVTISSTKTITVSWTAFPGATGYNVYRTITTDNRPTPDGVYVGAGNGYIPLTVGTAQTGWASPWNSYADSNATAPTLTVPPQLPPDVQLNSVVAATYAPNFLPINLYDPREGEVRDNSGPTTSSLNGIMNIVEIGVGKLQQWFAGHIGASGTLALPGPASTSGYILYTSDRRTNCSSGTAVEDACTGTETGLFGNEDIINPTVAAGTPNGVLDAPEDVVGDGVFRTYGATAHPIGICPVATCPGTPWPAFIATMPATNPAFKRITASQAQKNSVVIFRRALRLVNGTLGNLPPLAGASLAGCPAATVATQGGFTVTSEDPVYVQGDYNASVAEGFADDTVNNHCHVPAAVIGDAVTLLSNNWTPGPQPGLTSGDANSFANPTNVGCATQRCASTTWYRMAFLSGKTLSFPQPTTWGAQDSGTDGGTHNFLRYIEDWGGSTLNYTGSLASFYFGVQGTGIYKCCNTVYSPPTRAYAFDTDFQNISKLPPGTPRFTDVNALSYLQSILASQ